MRRRYSASPPRGGAGSVSGGGGSATSAPSAGSAAPSAAAPSGSASASAAAELKPIRLQLQWFPQAQFAGYFAAKDQGFYKDEGLDVTILPGAVEIVACHGRRRWTARNSASAGCRAMLARPRVAAPTSVVIGQVFQRSATLQVSFKDKNITEPEDLKGKKVGSWGFGNESELYAGLRKAGLDPGEPRRRHDRPAAVRHGRPCSPVRSMPRRR